VLEKVEKKVKENILNRAQFEVIEPETIRRLLPDISEEEFNKLEALITIKTSNYPFESFFAFENVVRALNGIVPNVNMVEGAEPEWIWFACEVFQKLRPKMEFSKEVIEYIKKIYSDAGIYFLHPYIFKNVTDTDLSTWAQIYAAAKHKVRTGPFPIEADSFLNRQAIELMKMELYSANQEKNK
jgi:hypothetical protein